MCTAKLSTSLRKIFLRGISFVIMLSWDTARTTRDRIRQCFARQSKVKKLHKINTKEIDKVAKCADYHTGLKGKTGSKRGRHYELNKAKDLGMREKLPRDRNDVSVKRAPDLVVRDDVTHLECNTQTGKVIRSEIAELLKDDPHSPTFVGAKAPTPASLYKRQSCLQSCDPAVVPEESKDSRVAVNNVILNVSAGNAWEETDNHSSIKTATLVAFVSRFKEGKKTIVKEVRL